MPRSWGRERITQYNRGLRGIRSRRKEEKRGIPPTNRPLLGSRQFPAIAMRTKFLSSLNLSCLYPPAQHVRRLNIVSDAAAFPSNSTDSSAVEKSVFPWSREGSETLKLGLLPLPNIKGRHRPPQTDSASAAAPFFGHENTKEGEAVANWALCVFKWRLPLTAAVLASIEDVIPRQ